MKVFGVGLSKTGTTTLETCLQSLGYKVKASDLELTRNMRQNNWHPIFRVADEYSGFEDFPWALVYKKMDVRYPDSKFILTVRKDSDTWFRSLQKHTERNGPSELMKLAYGSKTPHGLRQEHISYYNHHNQEVKKYFSGREEDLLEVCWETGDGWHKLCNFLGHKIPDKDFPHANRTPNKAEFYWGKIRGRVSKFLNFF